VGLTYSAPACSFEGTALENMRARDGKHVVFLNKTPLELCALENMRARDGKHVFLNKTPLELCADVLLSQKSNESCHIIKAALSLVQVPG
jgi:hypothetical protein